MALQPHWMDGVIEPLVDSGDAKKIAEAIAGDQHFLDAIHRGLGKRPPAEIMGATYAQMIQREIEDAVRRFPDSGSDATQ